MGASLKCVYLQGYRKIKIYLEKKYLVISLETFHTVLVYKFILSIINNLYRNKTLQWIDCSHYEVIWQLFVILKIKKIL